MKRILATILIGFILLTCEASNALAYTTGNNLSINSNGMVTHNVPYVNQDGRIFLWIRLIGSYLEIPDNDIIWDGSNQRVILKQDDNIVQLTIGSKTMVINGTPWEMDVSPALIESKTMIPIRFVAEVFGKNVNWDASSLTVILTDPYIVVNHELDQLAVLVEDFEEVVDDFDESQATLIAQNSTDLINQIMSDGATIDYKDIQLDMVKVLADMIGYCQFNSDANLQSYSINRSKLASEIIRLRTNGLL